MKDRLVANVEASLQASEKVGYVVVKGRMVCFGAA